jgi:uncharacterized membrane protein
MTTKRFLIAWLVTSIVSFILNGIFHGLIAADFFDKNNAVLGAAAIKSSDFNPAPIAILEIILSFCIVWSLSKLNLNSKGMTNAIIIGFLFHFAAASSYNLASTATIVSWPFVCTVVDVPWHALMGVISGWLAYKLSGLSTS